MALITAATLREYLPEIASNTEIDTELGNLLDRVEIGVANYLGFPFLESALTPTLATNTYTLYVDSPLDFDAYSLQIPISPVTSVTSVHADPNRQYTSETLIDSSTYDVDQSYGRIIIKPFNASRIFSTGYRSNKVVCVAGYTSGTLPADLKHGICVFASMLHRNKTSQGKDSTSTRVGSIKYSEKSMPLEVREFLYPYRAPMMIF